MAKTEEMEYLKKLASEIDMIRPDLQRLGFKRDNILILREYADYSAAIDVIFLHLQKPYLDRIHETLGRLLELPAAFPLWRDLVSMYQIADKDASPGLMTGLAVALSGHLKKSNSPELRQEVIKLLRDKSRGKTRVFFLSCFRRKRDEDSINLIDELSTDPDLKNEITSWKRKPKTER
ncbi:MAG: hypothetical protein WCI55_16970 [Armatimonadota bacterium]